VDGLRQSVEKIVLPFVRRLVASFPTRASLSPKEHGRGTCHADLSRSLFNMEESMLVLTRKVGEQIVIDGDICITIVAIKGDRVRLGITAPRETVVDGREIHERRSAQPVRAMEPRNLRW